jgi:hypothetical protein
MDDSVMGRKGRMHRPYCPSLQCNHISTKLDIYLILLALVAVWLGSAAAVSAGSSLLAGSAWPLGALPPTRLKTNKK